MPFKRISLLLLLQLNDSPLDRLSVMDERRMNDIGTNTSDVEVEPNRDRSKTSTVEANAHTSKPNVDVLLPSGYGDHVQISHVNLSP